MKIAVGDFQFERATASPIIGFAFFRRSNFRWLGVFKLLTEIGTATGIMPATSCCGISDDLTDDQNRNAHTTINADVSATNNELAAGRRSDLARAQFHTVSNPGTTCWSSSLNSRNSV